MPPKTKSPPVILSGKNTTEHALSFDHSPHQWRVQFWSSDAANDRFESETERVRVYVENPNDQPLAYHPAVDAQLLTIAPGEKALVFDDSIWELTLVNRSAEIEQTIFSSTERDGSLRLIFEPEIGDGREYRFEISLRRAVG